VPTQFNGYTNFINTAIAARISSVIAGQGITVFSNPAREAAHE